jgi:microcystin-dependent protein
MKGRFPLGDNASLTLLATGGSTTIAEGNLPAHSHANTASASSTSTTSITDPQHSHTITVSGAGTHNHTFQNADNAVYNVIDDFNDAAGLLVSGYTTTNVAGDGSHSHTGSSNSVSTGITASTTTTTTVTMTNAQTGSGTAYYQPYLVVNFIIKHDY